jgi:hypothetical protein
MAAFSSIFTFPADFAMLKKERASGMYRLSAYYAARTLRCENVLVALCAPNVSPPLTRRTDLQAHVCRLWLRPWLHSVLHLIAHSTPMVTQVGMLP